MDNSIKFIFGRCKCDHVWVIKNKVPKYCPQCHRRVDENTQLYRLISENAITNTGQAMPITIKAGTALEDYWKIDN